MERSTSLREAPTRKPDPDLNPELTLTLTLTVVEITVAPDGTLLTVSSVKRRARSCGASLLKMSIELITWVRDEG